jgi:hypothetical protein
MRSAVVVKLALAELIAQMALRQFLVSVNVGRQPPV